MTAPRRRPSYSLGWGTPHDHKTHSYWSVILSQSLAIPCTTITSTIHLGTRSIQLRQISFYACVTKIGLIDPDDQTEGLASTEHMEDEINQNLTERGILSICGSRPQSYPPPDALMETQDSSQVAQPLAEKGRLFVIP